MSGYKSGMKGADVVALLKNGLPIVDDVSKLDPNAELGSMASVVTPGSIQETSLSELPQADASIIDQTNGVLNASNCPLVSGLSVIVPTSTIPVTATISENEMMYFVSESLDMRGMSFGTMLGIMPLIQNGELSALMAVYMDMTTMTEQAFTLFYPIDGVVTADQDAINQVNTLINGLHYVGAIQHVMQGQTLSAEVLTVYDMVVKAVVEVPSIADIYVKGDKWGKLYKNDLAKLATSIDTVSKSVDTKADPIMVKSLPYNKRLTPNTYYTTTNSSTGTLTYVLIAPTDTTKYSEYILELKCTSTPSNISFTNESGTPLTIKWVNDTPPTFEAGFTYLISIENNFGVFAQYVNS